LRLPDALRRRIAHAARHRCGYCHTQEAISGIPLTVEHLVPRARGGCDDEDNLWLSCRLCNEAKGTQTEARDPDSGNIFPLFNPRTQDWQEHFEWRRGGTAVAGLTPAGRATVEALHMNSELQTRARALWVEVGWHPPD